MTDPTSQTDRAPAAETKPSADALAKAISGLKLRGIGPALMGGRIADIAVHPTRPGTWYVAVGSGGVWKTTNAGITWQPIFDGEGSYSIGIVALDPSNPETVWVGTGENVSGRHVGWGDGVYRSRDGGASWEKMGLETSEHIGAIHIDPRDSNVVLVAAEGPLWSAGGERGVYRTADGGATWDAVLTVDEHTGATDIVADPSNPDTLYAAMYQRRRHTWSFLGGGPGSGIYKSTDAGRTWRQVKTGLPKGDMGKIGLAVTPADPSIVFATVEAGEKEKGFYRSTDRGESWEKRSDYISNGTGPHYYQEIVASPHDRDTVYQVDVFLHVTRDGGKSFNSLEDGKHKHSDNHAIWIDPANGDHMLVGCDAGLYETFDEGGSWRHFPNLPVSQFYRLALDNAEPFYNILGGAQDLGTLYGPSRTTNTEGVRNQDWWVPTGADGYHVAFDPDDPNIFYLEYQNGFIFRYDKRIMEVIAIQPQPAPGEPPERWNWDTPIVISPHNPHRLYVGSYRVWRSDDRGDAWTAISGDLTTGQNRYEMAHMDRVWSVDDLYDNRAMSQYSTITQIDESPLVEGLLYVGTDDGLIQVSEDGGANWRTATELPGVPPLSFINDVVASQHDADTVYAIADAHKVGDYAPYVFESTDRGRTWRSIGGDLPDGTILWQLEQDHVTPDLLFAAAEYGLYVSLDRGGRWIKLSGAPTIAFRDLKLHRRDDDIVGATFGRGFYVLDDYTPLRTLATDGVPEKGALYPVRDAWWYVPYRPMQAVGQPTLGTTSYKAPNPPHGAVFTYYLAEKPLGARDARLKDEKALREKGENIPFPGWDRLHAETKDQGPQVVFQIRDAGGNAVRRLTGSAEAGLHRLNWDMRRSPPDPIQLNKPAFVNPWMPPPMGALVSPGDYTVEMMIVSADGVESIGAPQSFTLKPVPAMPADADHGAATAFQAEAADFLREVMGAGEALGSAQDRLNHLRAALLQAPTAEAALFSRVDALLATAIDLHTQLRNDEVRQKYSEPAALSIFGRAFRAFWGLRGSTQPPTQTHRDVLASAQADFDALRPPLQTLIESDLPQLEADIAAAGAPYTPSRRI